MKNSQRALIECSGGNHACQDTVAEAPKNRAGRRVSSGTSGGSIAACGAVGSLRSDRCDEGEESEGLGEHLCYGVGVVKVGDGR